MQTISGTGDFFDRISAEYDSMIGFDESVRRRKALLGKYLPNEAATIIDLGAGSGVDSISSSLLGHNVTAVDISGRMLKQLELNARKMQVIVATKTTPIHLIPQSYSESFDFALCLGNTLALTPPDRIQDSFRTIFSVLRSGGGALIQVLNYEKILAEKKRIVAITHNGDRHFIRFYDFIGEKVYFNILSYALTDTGNHSLSGTEIFPYSSGFLQNAVVNAGFQIEGTHGSLSGNDFIPSVSQDVILKLKKR